MPVLQAIGLGVLIIVLNLMSPRVLHEGEDTVIAILRGAQVGVSTATDLAASVHTAGTTPLSAPLLLPQAPQIRNR